MHGEVFASEVPWGPTWRGAKTASGQMNPSPAQAQRRVETDWKAEGQLVQMLARH